MMNHFFFTRIFTVFKGIQNFMIDANEFEQDLNRAISTRPQDLSLHGFIRRTTKSYENQGVLMNYSNSDWYKT